MLTISSVYYLLECDRPIVQRGKVFKDRQRMCDVCGEDILQGEKYRTATMPAQAAEMLSATDDPDSIPTWTVNDNGTVTLDICLTCTVSMGTLVPEGRSN